MTVENIKSVALTALDAAPTTFLRKTSNAGIVKTAQATVTTTGTTTTNTSTYRMIRLPSNAVLLFGTVQVVGSTDLPDADVGLQHVQVSTIVDDDCLATALDLDDTGDHKFFDDSTSAADRTKQLWEYVSGLTADPGGQFDIMISLDADAVAAGAVVMKVDYATA